MAIFNPGIPDTQDPNWLGWSKSITQPEGDKSTGMLLETGAVALGEGLKFADTAFKSVIEDDIYTQAKAEQQDYQNRLQDTRTALGIANAQSGKPGTILDSNNTGAPATPNALKGLNYQVDGLGQARANGHISETDYAMRLDTMAKDFRSRYPGYREFIDATVQKVTGIDPANKMITGAIADINTFASNLNTERNRTISLLTRDDVVKAGGDRVIQAYQNYVAGRTTATEATTIAMQGVAEAGKSDILKRRVEDANNNKAMVSVYAEPWAQGEAFKKASDNLQTWTIDAKGGPTLFTEFAKKYAPGTGNTLDTKEWLGFTQMVQANRDKMYNEMWDHFNSPIFNIPGSSRPQSLVQIKGGEYVKKLINDNLLWHDTIIATADKPNIGLLSTVATLNKATKDQTLANVYQQQPEIAVLGAYNDAAGPQFVGNFALKNSKELLLPFVDSAKLKAITGMVIGQPGMRAVNPSQGLFNPVAPDAQPFTLKEGLKRVQHNPVDPNSVPPTPELQKAIINLPQEITNKELPDTGKVNIIQASFSTGNQGFIDSIKNGATNKGVLIPNKMDAFVGMTKPDTIAEVKRLDAIYPEKGLWNMTKSWIGETFAQEVLHRELRDFNEAKANPNLRVDWDNTNHQWQVKRVGPPQDKPEFMPGAAVSGYYSAGNQDQIKQAEATVFRLNRGLAAVANVYIADGKDPNAGIVNLLLGLGIKPDNSFGGKMLNSIISSGKGEMTPAPTEQKLNYDVESAPTSGSLSRGSLDSFFKNPAGVVPYRLNNAPASLPMRPRGTPAPAQGQTVATRNLSNKDLISTTVEGADNDAFARINPNYGR